MAPPRRPWFRFYVEAIHDRKLRRRPPGDRWLWVVLLAVARESVEPGALMIGSGPASIEDLADLAALKQKDVESALAYFTLEGMLTDDGSRLVVTKFLARQFESDTSAVRMAKHRGSDDDVTAYQRHSDSVSPPDVTAMKRRSSRARVTDTEETENREQKEQNPPVGPPLPKRGAVPAKERATRISTDWQPSADMLSWAASQRPNVDVQDQTQRFKNHAAAKGRTLIDWSAGWRNWILGAEGFGQGKPNGHGSSSSNGHTPYHDPSPDEYADERIR